MLAATTPWNGHRLLDQSVARELTRYADVLYVEPPRSPLTRFRDGQPTVSAAGPREVDEGLWLVSPRVPPLKERAGMKAVSLALTRRAMRRSVLALGAPPVAAVIVPSLNPLFGACGERVRVFYAKDDYLAGAGLMGIHPRRLAARQRRQPRDADVVVAVSPELADTLGCPEAVVIPNGVDSDLYASVHEVAPAPEVRLAGPIAGFIGHVSRRIDLSILEALVSGGIQLLLVGPRPSGHDDARLEALLARPEVQWVGSQPPERLPAFMRHMSVGLVPYEDSAFNRASSPLKTLEYLAAGVPVVGTALPALLRIGGPDVAVATDERSFVALTRAMLDRPTLPGDVRRRQEQAAGHSWRRRVEILAHAIGLEPVRQLLPSPVPAGRENGAAL